MLYSCEATITSSDNDTHLIGADGAHEAGKTNANVAAFSVKSPNTMTVLPKGIEIIFSNLAALRWVDGNIQTVTSDDLEPFRNLLVLVLNGNQIVTLDSELFEHTRSVRAIYFSDNLLLHVGHGLFDGLDDLEYAQFLRNTCGSFSAYNAAQVRDLNLRLPVNCVPLATTTLETTTDYTSMTATRTQSLTTSSLSTAPTHPLPSTPPTLSTASTDPLTTTSTSWTEPDDCILSCSLYKVNELQDMKIKHLDEVIERYEQRLVEIEMQMREIGSSPCTSSCT